MNEIKLREDLIVGTCPKGECGGDLVAECDDLWWHREVCTKCRCGWCFQVPRPIAAATREAAMVSIVRRQRRTAHIIATLPLLTDAALAHLSAHVDTLEQRPLDSAALDRMQREREAQAGLAAVVGRWPGDESDAQIAAALEATS